MQLAPAELLTCEVCLSLNPVEEYRTERGWETTCLACRDSVPLTLQPPKRMRTNGIEALQTGLEIDPEVATSEVAALLELDLFKVALEGASPGAAAALMQQLQEALRRGLMGDELVADVALAYLALHTPAPVLPNGFQQQHSPAQQQGPASQEPQQQPAAASPSPSPQQVQQPPVLASQQAQQAALDAIPPRVLRIVLETPRCRRRLCRLARHSPLLLGQVLSVADASSLLSGGLLSEDDLLQALHQHARPGGPQLPALAAVAAAAALLASAPPGPSPQLLRLIQVLAEGHQLLAMVEAGHLTPAALRGALEGADAAAFTDIFRAMCSSDKGGQSFVKQCMQRAMPRADYGELMRISMLAEVAQTAATVTDRATLLALLDKAFSE